MQEILKKINNCNNKEEIKKIVRELYYNDNINDIDFDNIIYDYVIPKLEKLGCDMTYNETYNINNYEKVMQEIY